MTQDDTDRDALDIVRLEREALARWCKGDPSGFLEIVAPDVVYFDPFIKRRIDGVEALTQYYESIRGKVGAERFELLQPLVQRTGDMAVLTFNFVSFGAGGLVMRWNATEVYRREPNGWRIIQTHWSFTAPNQ